MFANDSVEALRQAAGAARRAAPQGRLWAVANHAGIPGLDARLQSDGIVRHSLFGEPPDAAARQVAPLLFALDELDAPRTQQLLVWLAHGGSYTGSLLFLWSPLPAAALHARLAQRLDARLHDGGDVVLRYFDARVFEALVPALTPAQRAAWLSPAHCWWYVDRAGLLQCCEGLPEVPEADALDAALQLDEAQLAALLDATEADQVAQLLQQRAGEPFLRIEPARRHAFVQRQLQQARGEWRLQSVNDLATYGALALLHGEDFAAAPAWQQALRRVAAGECTLVQAVAHVEDGAGA
jgi:hypothetical protein